MKATKTTKAFQDQLSDLVANSNKDLRTIASECGVKASSISNYQNDGAECGINNLVKLADYFGVSTDWLLGRAKEKAVNVDVQAAVRYTGLSEETINALRDANQLISQMNNTICTGSDLYHFDGNLTDLFFSNPFFQETIVAFYNYVKSTLSYESSQEFTIKDLKNRGLIPEEKSTITLKDFNNIADTMEDGDSRNHLISEGLFFIGQEDEIRFRKFCLIEKLGKIADSYKENIVKEE